MVIGIVVLLVSLLLPALQNTKSDAIRLACQSSMRDAMLGVYLYSNEHRSLFPSALTKDESVDEWVGLGGGRVGPDLYAGTQSAYWGYPVVGDAVDLSHQDWTRCPRNSEHETLLEKVEQKIGTGYSLPHDRLLSAAFYVRPSWLGTDHDQWDTAQLTVGKIDQIRYPSSKAGLYEQAPFHDENFESIFLPGIAPHYSVNVAAIDLSVQHRNTADATLPVLIGEPYHELRRVTSIYSMTRDGLLGRDW